jgi:hypothetical protein
MALRYAAIKATRRLLPDPFSLGDLRMVIDWFEQDISPATRNPAKTAHGLPVATSRSAPALLSRLPLRRSIRSLFLPATFRSRRRDGSAHPRRGTAIRSNSRSCGAGSTSRAAPPTTRRTSWS